MNLRGEISGAISAAIISMPMAIGYGLTVFAPLGSEFTAHAALIGLNAVIIGGFFSAVFSGTPGQVSGPPASQTMILSAIVVSLISTVQIPQSVELRDMFIVGLISFCVMIGGVSQILFGILRMGNIAKYVPYPVVTGFMNGIAVILIWKQLPLILGLDNGIGVINFFVAGNPVNMSTLLIGLSTFTVVLLVRRFLKSVPALPCGFFAGILVYLLLSLSNGISQNIPIIGILQAKVPTLVQLQKTVLKQFGSLHFSIILDLCTYGLLLGMIGSLESLMSSLALDNVSGARHNSKQELISQGIGNFIAGLFGSISLAGSILRSGANYRAGGRSKLSAALCSVMIFILYLTTAPLIGRIPLAVFGGVIISVGLSLFDRSTLNLIKSVIHKSKFRKDVLATLLVNVSVAIITIFIDLTTAIIIGIAISMVYFVLKIETSIIRRKYSGHELSSKKVREVKQHIYLMEKGKEIFIFELQGPIFFGSAEKLARTIENETSNVTYCILDMKLVTEIDISGANILIRLFKMLKVHNKSLLISYITENHPLWGFLSITGLVASTDRQIFFNDTDEALEWVEDQLLSDWFPKESDKRYHLEDLDIFKGISPIELEIVKKRLDFQNLSAGKTVIQEGQISKDLYLLTRGSFSVKMNLPHSGRNIRLSTYSAGSIFGELALLDGYVRSADVITEEESDLYRLSYENFDELRREHPQLVSKLLANMTLVVSHRLRVRTEEVRLLEDS